MKRIKKARCADCQHFCRYSGAPVKERGVTLQPGQRYCMAGKKPRRFKPRDPKVYPPKWCSAKVFPPLLHIYEVRPDRSMLHTLVKKTCRCQRIAFQPWPYHYALRMTGTALAEAREFYKKVAECRRKEGYVARAMVEDLLGVKIWEEEIVKFDDGILPVFFMWNRESPA